MAQSTNLDNPFLAWYLVISALRGTALEYGTKDSRKKLSLGNFLRKVRTPNEMSAARKRGRRKPMESATENNRHHSLL